MKTLALTAFLSIFQLLPASGIQHVRQGPYSMPTVKLIGRIEITADTLHGFRSAQWYMAKYGDGFTAQFYGAQQLSNEADERVALALEAFRWKDPQFFDLVMTSYQIRLLDH